MGNINCFINLAKLLFPGLHSFLSLSRVITTANAANPEFLSRQLRFRVIVDGDSIQGVLSFKVIIKIFSSPGRTFCYIIVVLLLFFSYFSFNGMLLFFF